MILPPPRRNDSVQLFGVRGQSAAATPLLLLPLACGGIHQTVSQIRLARPYSLSPGERAGVRGKGASNCIVAAKGEGRGDGELRFRLHHTGAPPREHKSEQRPRFSRNHFSRTRILNLFALYEPAFPANVQSGFPLPWLPIPMSAPLPALQ